MLTLSRSAYFLFQISVSIKESKTKKCQPQPVFKYLIQKSKGLREKIFNITIDKWELHAQQNAQLQNMTTNHNMLNT